MGAIKKSEFSKFSELDDYEVADNVILQDDRENSLNWTYFKSKSNI